MIISISFIPTLVIFSVIISNGSLLAIVFAFLQLRKTYYNFVQFQKEQSDRSGGSKKKSFMYVYIIIGVPTMIVLYYTHYYSKKN